MAYRKLVRLVALGFVVVAAGTGCQEVDDLDLVADTDIPLAVHELTETEKRNLERAGQWAKESSTPGGNLETLVNDIYAESPEVLLPLNSPPLYVVRRGESKANFHKLELSGRGNAYSKRVLGLVNTVVQDNRVAGEVVVSRETPDGRPFEQRIAVFLTFDDEGKVVVDHTYAGTMDLEALMPNLPEDGKEALKAILENQ